MIRPPSNQHPYDEYCSLDPAFVQPPGEPPAPSSDATNVQREHYEAAIKAHAEAVAAHAGKIKHARETGNWTALLLEGATPTKFVLKPLGGDQVRWILDRVRAGVFGALEAHALAFRCALVDVVNFGDAKVGTPVNHEHLGKIASKVVPNMLDAYDINIVNELGDLVVERASPMGGAPLPPKS